MDLALVYHAPRRPYSTARGCSVFLFSRWIFPFPVLPWLGTISQHMPTRNRATPPHPHPSLFMSSQGQAWGYVVSSVSLGEPVSMWDMSPACGGLGCTYYVTGCQSSGHVGYVAWFTGPGCYGLCQVGICRLTHGCTLGRREGPTRATGMHTDARGLFRLAFHSVKQGQAGSGSQLDPTASPGWPDCKSPVQCFRRSPAICRLSKLQSRSPDNQHTIE